MRYFIAFCIFSIYLFAYSYQPELYDDSNVITVGEDDEYVILNNNIEEKNSNNLNIEEEYVELEHTTPTIKYIALEKAKKEAKVEHKFVLVKIESSSCPTCIELNKLLETNTNIQNMINGYTKAVKLNRDYDQIPPKLKYIGTPTLFLFDSNGKKMLIKLEGAEAIDDIEESLELFIYDKS